MSETQRGGFPIWQEYTDLAGNRLWFGHYPGHAKAIMQIHRLGHHESAEFQITLAQLECHRDLLVRLLGSGPYAGHRVPHPSRFEPDGSFVASPTEPPSLQTQIDAIKSRLDTVEQVVRIAGYPR